ncbi:hypothetical protein C5467_23660 [Photorhabdus khanii subsp. guanajuatensis]|uniref:Uncharacterized protein n=1 Tax=Photorhabdus khanii subsp. guanajuatensis TaxID=2100166 RepID=A0A4R4IPW5_9GAMM|nr:hypothetical protein C5467_23660 [Photorhabdus khanii subsp. guanajuatensis]
MGSDYSKDLVIEHLQVIHLTHIEALALTQTVKRLCWLYIRRPQDHGVSFLLSIYLYDVCFFQSFFIFCSNKPH